MRSPLDEASLITVNQVMSSASTEIHDTGDLHNRRQVAIWVQYLSTFFPNLSAMTPFHP